MIRDNYLMKIGWNDSGMFSGEMDYSFIPDKLDSLNLEDTKQAKFLLNELLERVEKSIEAKGGRTTLGFKLRKLIHFRYSPLTSKGYVYWPIKLKLRNHCSQPYITCWGWQIGCKNGQREYGWTLSIGRLLVLFGKRTNL